MTGAHRRCQTLYQNRLFKHEGTVQDRATDNSDTGYSSLSHLKQQPINKLKIDRSFAGVINNDMEDATLVQAIIARGKSPNLELVADGGELSSHELFLCAHGCKYAQGFYYSKPLPGGEIEKLYRDKAGIGAIISS